MVDRGESVKSLEKLVIDVFLVVDHDYDLKNRRYNCRFRVNAIHILSLPGGSTRVTAVCIIRAFLEVSQR